MNALVSRTDGMGRSPAEAAPAPERIRTEENRIGRTGGWIVFGALGSFLAWATLFPISSAVIASGELVTSGQNKLVQHQTGGRVDAIMVADGDRVRRGDVIVRLDDRDAKAALTTLEARYGRLAAARNRLLVEKGEEPLPLYPSALRTPDVVSLSAKASLRGSHVPAPSSLSGALESEQQNELRFGTQRRAAEIEAARARIEALGQRQTGLKERITRTKAARRRLSERVKRMRPLVREGFIAKARLWELEERLDREDAAAEDARARLEETRQEIAEATAARARLEAGTGERTARELTQTLAELAELEDQILAARNRLDLLAVRAPASGTVTGLQSNTVGGVVPPGGTIATVVPSEGGAPLVVEARLRAKDVDAVVQDQEAEIVLTAFSRRKVEPLPGRVIYVAADSADPGSVAGQPAAAPQPGRFYTVRVAFEGPLDAAVSAKLRSGMPADAFIRAEPRTFLSYMLDPLTDSLARAFRDPN